MEILVIEYIICPEVKYEDDGKHNQGGYRKYWGSY